MRDTILHGDALSTLRTLPAESVQTCVTSPPYWGLRDYGVPGQLGLEPTPDEYVARLVGIFAEVRRVLRPDGTLWLNLGDSYTSGNSGQRQSSLDRGGVKTRTANCGRPPLAGYKPKDLVGIPWRVAFALQQPYYTGRIKDERARTWLAAMLDAEGCIYIHKRGAGLNAGDGYVRKTDTYGVGIEIANTHLAIVQRCAEIAGCGSIMRHDKDRRQPLYRWRVRTTEARDLLRELYPHLVGKRQQARIGYGCPSNGEQAEAAHEALKLLHGGSETTVDFPEPASMLEPGWYLRSDVIWAKPNPMPESVRDRPTKAHEYLFLLAKSERYYYDADAIREAATNGERFHGAYGKPGVLTSITRSRNGRDSAANTTAGRNRRSVWTIATRPYSGAHFATFPPALVEPCVLAGSPPQTCEHCGAPWRRVVERERVGDNLGRRTDNPRAGIRGSGLSRPPKTVAVTQFTGWAPSCRCEHNTGSGHAIVLDPFIGAGTVACVVRQHSRHYLGIELNAEYIDLARQRIEATRQPILLVAPLAQSGAARSRRNPSKRASA